MRGEIELSIGNLKDWGWKDVSNSLASKLANVMLVMGAYS